MQPVVIIMAGGIRDALGISLRPGAVVISEGRILDVLPPETAKTKYPHARIINHFQHLLLPMFVNAHAHLDLTLMGSRSYGGKFADWLLEIAQIRRLNIEKNRGTSGINAVGQTTTSSQPGQQNTQDLQADDIRRSVLQGLKWSEQAAVGWIGDIAGSPQAAQARLLAPPDAALPGVSFVECMGIGQQQMEGFVSLMKALTEISRELDHHSKHRLKEKKQNTKVDWRLHLPSGVGISPHAPYTAGETLYALATQWATQRQIPLCTHLAESPAELEFLNTLTGPLVELRKKLGRWDSALQPSGKHPVDWLQPILEQNGPHWLLVHANYLDPKHIEIIAQSHASVVYCPLASAYFGFPHDREHPYQQLINAGVNVCLGTDSILCQPESELQPMGVWPQMRYLYRRDGIDAGVLLQMATLNGLQALGINSKQATLAVGNPARFAMIEIEPGNPRDLLEQALISDRKIHPWTIYHLNDNSF